MHQSEIYFMVKYSKPKLANENFIEPTLRGKYNEKLKLILFFCFYKKK